MTQSSFRVRVSGRVQGVCYRASTQQKGRELGIGGWVRNLPDGCVEAYLEGDEDAVEAMLSWMKQGPSAAHVDDLQAEPVTPENCRDFQVI